MRFRNILTAAAAALLAGLPAQQALASDGITYGYVIGVEVNGVMTRVYFTGHPVFCNGGNKFAYVIPNEANYATYVSTALAAMAQKTPMIAYTDSEGGMCHLVTLVAGSSPF